MKYFFVLFFGLCLLLGKADKMSAQQNKAVSGASKAFIIGDEEKRYETIINQYPTMLFQVCDDSMEEAYGYWNGMLKEMEVYAQKMHIDLRGVKIWMNVFWSQEGKIDYIVYHPKPNSKNMNYQELSQFFHSFTGQYQLPLKASKKFSHYGSASFPLFNKAILAQEK